jgi:DinB superfamily
MKTNPRAKASSKPKKQDQDNDQPLRQHLLELLAGGGAHAKFEDVVPGIPPNLRGVKPEGLPHSPWMLLEHMRIAQWDILEFSRNPKHESPDWPKAYWPATEAPPDSTAWEKSVQQFNKDLKAMQALVADAKTDLFARIAWGDSQTILREALLVADHNAYHLAQVLDVRRLLGAWPEKN